MRNRGGVLGGGGRGKQHWLWQAVNDSGTVLESIQHACQEMHAAPIFFEKLSATSDVPDVIHTDKLWAAI
ncbi:DDE-type integrase/transposase/recombinase [Deinococcus oregonensis]|uniref:DDE-type integrase/transposase/recombinase n=1 Tax=Deinococcus oregonensis TaxID=1805970 RepID=A0ABV6AYY4_9DEIO